MEEEYLVYLFDGIDEIQLFGDRVVEVLTRENAVQRVEAGGNLKKYYPVKIKKSDILGISEREVFFAKIGKHRTSRGGRKSFTVTVLTLKDGENSVIKIDTEKERLGLWRAIKEKC